MREAHGEWQPAIDEEIARWLPHEVDESYPSSFVVERDLRCRFAGA